VHAAVELGALRCDGRSGTGRRRRRFRAKPLKLSEVLSMLPDQEDRIRRRAYEIWEREGRPDGRQADHWAAAQAELEDEARRPSETQEVPAVRIDQSAPPAAELAERDSSGRARMSPEQERREQIAAAPEAEPLGAVTASGPAPSVDQTAASERAVAPEAQADAGAKPKRRGGRAPAKPRGARAKKAPDQPPS
jgi:hypothetical protein